jgi:hypothetical protein
LAFLPRFLSTQERDFNFFFFIHITKKKMLMYRFSIYVCMCVCACLWGCVRVYIRKDMFLVYSFWYISIYVSIKLTLNGKIGIPHRRLHIVMAPPNFFSCCSIWVYVVTWRRYHLCILQEIKIISLSNCQKKLFSIFRNLFRLKSYFEKHFDCWLET